MNKTNSILPRSPKVTISKHLSPKTAFLEGIQNLGGIGDYISRGDKIFIKVNLMAPEGYPTNFNFDLIKIIVEECRKLDAEVKIGSFPYFNVSTLQLSNFIGLQDYIDEIGGKFVLLDHSDLLDKKNLKRQKLKELKEAYYVNKVINEKEYLYPKSILESDKLLILNQFNVNPIFDFNLSLFNLYYSVPYFSRNIESSPEEFQEFKEKSNKVTGIDYYNLKTADKTVDIYSIKKPDLVINDLFYIFEFAGPFYFSDSNVKKTNIIIIGNEAISTDIITLRLLDQNIFANEIILQAREREFGPKDLSEVETIGFSLEDNKISVNLCPKKLNQIEIINTEIKTGNICMGCYNQLYYLLNYLKTYTIKDLKYIQDWSILAGLNPAEPTNQDDILIFGDCALRTTEQYKFRTKIKKTLIKKHEKEVKNKNIIEVPGCPPTLERTFNYLLNYFGKKIMPSMKFFLKLEKIYEYRNTFQKNLNKLAELSKKSGK